jgi:tight adherence protein C
MITGFVLLGAAAAGMVLVVVLLTTAPSSDPVASRVHEIREASRRMSPQLVFSPAGLVVAPSAPSQAEVEAARRERMKDRKTTLRDRLVQAGLYRAYSPVTFAIIRGMLAVIPLVAGIAAGMMGVTTMTVGLAGGLLAAALGTLAPSFWLDHQKSSRQRQLRRSLPDALDVIVVCLEGGLSLTGAFARVSQELGGRASAFGDGTADRAARGADGPLDGRGAAQSGDAVRPGRAAEPGRGD